MNGSPLKSIWDASAVEEDAASGVADASGASDGAGVGVGVVSGFSPLPSSFQGSVVTMSGLYMISASATSA